MAVWSKNLQAQSARYEAMGAYFDSMKSTYEFQGRQQESMAKFNADREYSKATGGKTFDSSHRPSDAREREAWETAKKVHDIFD